MTREEFTGVTFNDFELSGIRISRSSEFSLASKTEIALNLSHKSAYFMNRKTIAYRQDNSLC